MESLLTLLFERYDRLHAMTLLRDERERERAVIELDTELSQLDMPSGMFSTAEGSNLFVAVLALRLKFSEEEAMEKVRLNIAMREGRR